MEFKDFQDDVLNKLDAYLDELRTQKANAIDVEQGFEKLKLANPKLKIPVPDFCGDAWAEQKSKGLLVRLQRGRPNIRNICI